MIIRVVPSTSSLTLFPSALIETLIKPTACSTQYSQAIRRRAGDNISACFRWQTDDHISFLVWTHRKEDPLHLQDSTGCESASPTGCSSSARPARMNIFWRDNKLFWPLWSSKLAFWPQYFIRYSLCSIFNMLFGLFLLSNCVNAITYKQFPH